MLRRAAKPLPLTTPWYLAAVLLLESAMEITFLGLNFFLSKWIVITGSVKVNDIAFAGILENRILPTQSAFLDRRKFHMAVVAARQKCFQDHGFIHRR